MRNTFTKAERLCSQTAKDWLFDGQGNSFSVWPFHIVFKSRPLPDSDSEVPLPQLLISVPKKKIRHAVQRNRVKRLVREAYRTQKHPLVEAVQTGRQELCFAVIYLSDELPTAAETERRLASAIARMTKMLGHGNA